MTAAKRNAGAQLVGLGKGQARVHQGLVLLLVAGVVAQEAAPGELGHLFVDQALLVTAQGGTGTIDLIAACVISMRAMC